MPRNNDGSVTLPISFAKEDELNADFTGKKLDLPLKDLANIAADSLDVYSRNSMQANLNMGGKRITKVKDGIELTDVATVAQASEGSIFAEDISNDSNKIDLVQKPLQSVKEYKNGMQITFIAKHMSVNNMQIQLNGLGYKPFKWVGYGSYGAKEGITTITIMFVAHINSFIPIQGSGCIPLTTGEHLEDFNQVTENARIWCIETGNTENAPEKEHGLLECIKYPTTNFAKQIYYSDSGKIFYRNMANGEWKSWGAFIPTNSYTNSEEVDINDINELKKQVNELTKKINILTLRLHS